MTSAVDRGEWSASRPGHSTPMERASVETGILLAIAFVMAEDARTVIAQSVQR
jgi:hypothetical protein